MFRITKNNGTIFIYVWAKKQPENSRFKFDKSDTLVPFKYNDNIFYRYYHLYEENELMNEVKKITKDLKRETTISVSTLTPKRHKDSQDWREWRRPKAV